MHLWISCCNANRILNSIETKSTNEYYLHLVEVPKLKNQPKKCGENDSPAKPKVDLVEANDYDDVIIVVIS